ncbi:MAG: hypothetical protein AB1585_06005 [Thermodesulfobacteriota bacterium]
MGMMIISFAAASEKAPIIKLVQTILADPDSPSVPQLETEINHLVYGLYNLTPEEIELVETYGNNKQEGN